MDDLFATLRDPEKMEDLILKLKTMGEDSPQFQTFQKSFDSFRLNKPPRGVHAKTSLQTIFKFSNPRECFQSFRLVCKSWQHSVETIRFDRYVDVTLKELSDVERNGNFPPFYPKYLQTFRKLNLKLKINFDNSKWDPISNLLVRNMKNVNKLWITTKKELPPNFDKFLFRFLKNSQSTLITFGTVIQAISFMPQLPLKNLEYMILRFPKPHDQDEYVELVDLFLTQFINQYTSLRELRLNKICRSPKVLKHVVENYPLHFYLAPEISVLDHIPLKISYLDLTKLGPKTFISAIKYLILKVPMAPNPNAGGWHRLREIPSLCPNLKGITFFSEAKQRHIDLSKMCAFSGWSRMLQFFESRNIKILTKCELGEILDDLYESNPTKWDFDFSLENI